VPSSISKIEGSSLITMSSICVENPNEFLSFDSSFVYGNSKKTIIRYFGCDSKVIIFAGIEILGESSFCESRTERIVIPSSVRIFESYCFSKCEALESIEFENDSKLFRIESFAFAWSSLKFVKLPDSIEFLHVTAFCGVSNVSFESNDHFQLKSDLMSNSDGSHLVSCLSRLSEIEISKVIVELESFAFCNCTSLHLIRFEDCSLLHVIGSHCFENSNVERISIPSSVEEIGDFAFSKCGYLIYFSIESHSQLRYLGYGAFLESRIMKLTLSDCVELSTFGLNVFESSPLQQISLPSNLEILCSNCFLKCIYLNKFSWSGNSKLRLLDSHAFEGCGIEKIDIPFSVEEISHHCFFNCKSLQKIVFDS
jgi:hypothetical protein